MIRCRSTYLAAALVACLTLPATADVRSLTLGITVNCPYGLAG
jgi:hypothetical protein